MNRLIGTTEKDAACPRRLEIRKDSMGQMLPEALEYEVRDTLLPGFGVRVSPKGLRTFIFRWSQDGKDHKATLGRFPGMPAAAARKKAEGWFGLVARGEDPRQDLATAKAVRTAGRETMADLFDRFETEVLPSLKENTQRDYQSVLRMLRASFGATPCRALDLESIKAYHLEMAGTPRAANKQVAILSSVLTHGERVGMRDMRSNPCYLVEHYPEVKRVRSLTPKEAVAFGRLLAKEEEANPIAVAVLRMMLVTGARPGELLALEWSWVDLKAGVITVPRAHHKTGRKTGEDRFIGLGPSAIRLLKDRQKVATSRWVFPNPKGDGPFKGLNSFWKRLHSPQDGGPDKLESAGILDFHPYDLRHTWATWARRGGQGLEDLADMLGHTDIRMTRRYAHAQTDQIRQGALTVEKALKRKR